MSHSAILTRLAIEAYWQTKLYPNTSGRWQFSSTYKVASLLLDEPELVTTGKPLPYCMCLHCGNVVAQNIPTSWLFIKACKRCFDEHTIDARRGFLLHGCTGWVTPESGVSNAIVMRPVALADYNEYLKKISLTGANPFETIIEEYKSRLS